MPDRVLFGLHSRSERDGKIDTQCGMPKAYELKEDGIFSSCACTVLVSFTGQKLIPLLLTFLVPVMCSCQCIRHE
jgi:hypothetical protein